MLINHMVHITLEFGTAPLRLEMVPTPTPPTPPPSPVRCVVLSQVDGFTVTATGDHMAYTLPDDKQIKVQVNYVDAKGNPAKVDGDVEWTTSDDMIANVGVLQGDSTKAQIAPGKNLGQAQITATADADVGAGVQELICTMDVEVVAGSAVAGTITPEGDPQPQAKKK